MNTLFFRDKPIIGLDVSQTGIKVMAINSKRFLVEGYGSVDLDPVKAQKMLEDKDTSYLSENIKELIDHHIVGILPSKHVVLGIPTNRSYSHTFTLPIKAEKSIRDTVELEVNQYIPVPYETLYIDYEIIDRTKDDLTAILSAAPKEIVDHIVEATKAAGLQPIMVEPSINAVARILRATERADMSTVIIDIGATGTDIAVFNHGAIRVTGFAAAGGNSFTLAIAKALKTDLENAHQLKVLSGLNHGSRQAKLTDALSPSLDKIGTEIVKIIRYYNDRLNPNKTDKIEQILIVGGGANVPGIGEYFTDLLGMPARVAIPWQKMNFEKLPQPDKQYRSRYATVAGLASAPRGEILL